MSDRRYRVLYVCTHPVQYAAPLFARMAKHPALDITVAYCSLQGAASTIDADFGVEVVWDVPLLAGYEWRNVPNRSLWPGLGRALGLVNPGLWRLIRNGGFDAVVALIGYKYASFWLLALAAKVYGSALLFGTDAHELASQHGSSWRRYAKRFAWPRLFRLADVVIVPSSQSVRLMRSLGIPAARIVLTPYVVDNEWWRERAAAVDRNGVRAEWKVPDDAPIVAFAGKLQRWKRPADLLTAFAETGIKDAFLVYAGDGALRPELEALARRLNISGRVRFLGFMNQSQMPGVYTAADLLVLPSEYEPFGVVVNEAMLCGCAALVSDRVGAGFDLIRHGENGFVFRAGDVPALSGSLRQALADPERLRRMGQKGRERMIAWSPHESIDAHVRAVESAVAGRSGGRGRG